MSNQEPQNQSKTTKETEVEKRRRFIKGAAAAPVVLTLASPSVFGQALCLSQQLSGNASGAPTGSCAIGQPPAFWRNPLNKGSWPTGAGFTYGTGTSTTSCTAYTGGTTFNDSNAFGTAIRCITPTQPTQPMRLIMCAAQNSAQSIWSAAMLNSVDTSIVYVLNKTQLLEMWNGHQAPPLPFSNTCAGKLEFLKSTMGLPFVVV